MAYGLSLAEAQHHAHTYAEMLGLDYDAETRQWIDYDANDPAPPLAWAWAHAARTPRVFAPAEHVFDTLAAEAITTLDIEALEALCEWWLTLRTRKGTVSADAMRRYLAS